MLKPKTQNFVKAGRRPRPTPRNEYTAAPWSQLQDTANIIPIYHYVVPVPPLALPTGRQLHFGGLFNTLSNSEFYINN